MPKLILTSVGTSVARTFSGDDTYKAIIGQPIENLEKHKKECGSLKKLIIENIRLLDLDTEKGLQEASAEIKSLKKIGVNRADEIVLFATDTADGKLCAEVIEAFIQEYWQCKTQLEVIEGLQVTDAQKFEREGVKNYLERLLQLMENFRYGDVILNPTGGFKSVVPYTTLAAMLFQKPSQYIFEFSTSLLTLPPIPLAYNFDPIEKTKAKFERIYEETYISEQDFWDGISYEERPNYEPLLHREEGLVSLSNIGFLVYEKYRSENPPPIKESTNAPDEKDGLRDDGSEPHRTKKFIAFRDKLKEHKYVNYFRYVRGCEMSAGRVRIIEKGILEASYQAICVEVQTTAIHPKHDEIICGEIRYLME